MASLLIHDPDLSAPVREAIQAAHASRPDARDDLLAEAARLLYRETSLECADVRELVGLSSSD
jgi:hypothetical protein